MSPVELTDGRGVRGRGKAKLDDDEKALFSINHSILSGSGIESHETVFQSLKPELEGTYTCKAANKLGQIETAYQVQSDVIMTSVYKREKYSIENA